MGGSEFIVVLTEINLEFCERFNNFLEMFEFILVLTRTNLAHRFRGLADDFKTKTLLCLLENRIKVVWKVT